jgi:hypothetical protein
MSGVVLIQYSGAWRGRSEQKQTERKCLSYLRERIKEERSEWGKRKGRDKKVLVKFGEYHRHACSALHCVRRMPPAREAR